MWKLIQDKENKKCDYCGQQAHYESNKGKLCCSDNISKCKSISFKNKSSHTAWNKGLKGNYPYKPAITGKTFEQMYGERTKEIKDKLSIRCKNSKGVGADECKEKIRCDKIRNSINKRYRDGWLPKAGRCKKIKYESPIAGNVLLDGSWQLLTAKWLDHENIKWQRNKKRFKYIKPEGKEGFYTPDFYVNDDYYLEVKGYETDLDKAKWSQFKEKLVVFKKEDIKRIKGEVL